VVPILTPIPPRSFDFKHAVPAVIAAVAALLVYAVTLAGTYVYDDVAVVQQDQRVRKIDQWPQILTRDYFNGGVDNLYRPIVTFSYAFEWWIHGDRPWLFHLVNVLLNAVVAGMVAEMTRRLAMLGSHPRANTAALMAGLLFAVHPVHVEAVANIVGRAELASALCVVLAIVLLLPPLAPRFAGAEPGQRPGLTEGTFSQPADGVHVAAALAIAVLGLFCKEQALLQPLLWLFGWFLLIRGRFTLTEKSRPSGRLLLLATCWIWAAYLVLREHFFRFDWDRSFLDYSVQPMVLSNGIDRVLMLIVLIGHYARLLVWPTHLSPDYGGDVIGSAVHLSDPYLWTGVAAILVWIAAVVVRRRNRPLVFCLLCFAAIYGMTGNIITLIGTNLSERLMYLPSAFLFAAIGIAASGIKARPSGPPPIRVACLIFSVALALMSWQTVSYARQWNHPSELFATALKAHPGSVQLYLLLAQEDRNDHRYGDAETVLAAACARHRNYYRVWVERANNAMDMQDWPAAHRWLAVAMNADGNHMQIATAMAELQKREPKTALSNPRSSTRQ
jgi:hypothetical protein